MYIQTKIEGFMTKFVMSSKMAKLECENHMEGIIRESGSYHHSMPWAMFPFRNLVQKNLTFWSVSVCCVCCNFSETSRIANLREEKQLSHRISQVPQAYTEEYNFSFFFQVKS